MTDPTFAQFLITSLEALAAKRVTNRKELASWRLEADRLEESFTPEQAEMVPDFVWHFLGDADIRLRNASYGADQERRLEDVLRKLAPRGGRIIRASAS